MTAGSAAPVPGNGTCTMSSPVMRLKISPACPLILPSHVRLDRAREQARGDQKIGTTGRGIGPCYQDKIARIGIRVADVLDEGQLAQKIEAALEFKNQVLVKIYNRKALVADEVTEQLLAKADVMVKGSDGKVLVPPFEYDPYTAESLTEIVAACQAEAHITLMKASNIDTYSRKPLIDLMQQTFDLSHIDKAWTQFIKRFSTSHMRKKTTVHL